MGTYPELVRGTWTYRFSQKLESREGAGVLFLFPTLFGGGDVFQEWAEVVIDDSGIVETRSVFLGAFAEGDFGEGEISDRF